MQVMYKDSAVAVELDDEGCVIYNVSKAPFTILDDLFGRRYHLKAEGKTVIPKGKGGNITAGQFETWYLEPFGRFDKQGHWIWHLFFDDDDEKAARLAGLL